LVFGWKKHWHGATASTAMSRIAIAEKLDGKAVDWMEKVTNQQDQGPSASTRSESGDWRCHPSRDACQCGRWNRRRCLQPRLEWRREGWIGSVDYGGVRNVLLALGSRPARIALMTAAGVTNRTGSYNRTTEAHDRKRRSERLVRACGLPDTVVRPGWFDSSPPGPYKAPQIYQAPRTAAVFDNRHTVLGLWMIDQDCCGMGVRESFSPITGNLSSFVPHFFI
jgi:hypothetical protein